jgi:CRP/FNR family transcriptional regulator, cyclic AMP receptor protein
MRKVLFLFGQLNDDDIEWMLRAGGKREIPADGVLITQGVPAPAVFIVLAGRFAVKLRAKAGPDAEIARLQAGEIVGEMSFIDARPPSATVQALDDATVFVLPKTTLQTKLDTDQGFAARFYRALAIYLSTTVRERHRALGIGVPGGDEDDDGEVEGELDVAVLDGVSRAGERFDRMVKQVLAA